MALNKKEENKVSARIFGCLSLTVAVVLLVAGLFLWKTGHSVVTMVNKGLVDEKIYFPPEAGLAAFPDVQEHAGKQVVDGAMAKVYAEDFIGEQMVMLSDGKTSSEVSALAAADPGNAGLQQLQGAMFQMGTSKTLLLSAYGSWMQGKMMKTMGVVALLGGMVLLLGSAMQYSRYKRL